VAGSAPAPSGYEPGALLLSYTLSRPRLDHDLRSTNGATRSEARVDGLALHGQHAEHALVHPVERLVSHESLERLDAEPELADRERALAPEAAGAQPIDLAGVGVFEAADDAQVLAAAALDAGLDEALAPARDEAQRRLAST
jgi:hypothetical protein